MIKISQIVSELISGDDVALEALRAKILNLSAYAEQIRPKIENRLYKTVKKGSIVTALSRMSQEAVHTPPLKVPIHIEDLSIKSPLCEISYEKTDNIAKKIATIAVKYSTKGFFTSTQGIGEVTLILSQDLKSSVIKQIGVKPKGVYDNLSAITLRFIEEDYIEAPNMIYTLISALAARRINLIEIVSTFTEISFIVRQKDSKATIEVLKDNFLQ